MSFGLSLINLDLAAQEDRRRNKVRKNAMRRGKWDAFEMSDQEFIKTFRLSKGLVENLITDVSPIIERERKRDALSIKDKVLVTLAFYATGSYQTLVGQSMYHAISQPSVSRVISQVTSALNNRDLFKKYVSFPTQRQDREKIKKCFFTKYQMPGVIGCIDGTHVAIIRPKHNEERYFNRKGYHSLNVMIICDSQLNILCVDPSHPGATHDSSAWREHPLNNYMEQMYNSGETVYFLGDSGYPLRKTLMTPYLHAVDGSPEAHYYNLHVTARNVVERCIGVLKGRFRCLLSARKLHYSPTMAAKIVNACVVLHNMANKAQIAVPELSPEELEEENNNQVQHSTAEMSFRSELLSMETEPERSRVNVQLHHGRLAQQALIRRLWMEYNQSN